MKHLSKYRFLKVMAIPAFLGMISCAIFQQSITGFSFVGTVVEIKTDAMNSDGIAVSQPTVSCIISSSNKVPSAMTISPPAVSGLVSISGLDAGKLPYKIQAAKTGFTNSVFFLKAVDKYTNNNPPVKIRMYSSKNRTGSLLRVWVYNANDLSAVSGAKVSIVNNANANTYAMVSISETAGMDQGAAVFTGIQMGATYTVKVFTDPAKPLDTFTLSTSGLASDVNDISTYSIIQP